MLRLALFTLIILTTNMSYGQKNGNCSLHYEFEGAYIDLEELESELIDAELGFPHFKTCSKYKNRFRKEERGKAMIGEVTYQFYRERDEGIYQLHLVENGVIKKKIDLPTENPLPEVQDYHASVLAFEEEVVILFQDFYGTEYIILKYDKEGNELLRTTLEHTYVTHPEPNTNHHNPYLDYQDRTQNHIIFYSRDFHKDKPQTVLLDIKDFSIKTYDVASHGILLDENEEDILGFITMMEHKEGQGTKHVLTILNGMTYTFYLPYGSGSYNLLLNGNLLYIANYHEISTGSSLHCFNLETEKVEWHADVLQLSVDHSKYLNKVTLSMYENKLIMEGNEMGGNYVQFFDTKTGERLAEFGGFWRR